MAMAGGGPTLQIALSSDDGRRISFETQPGIVYTIEESVDLLNWSLLDTVVADDTSEAFFSFGSDMRFYRVIKGSDLIQFPNFHPVVDQSCYVDVYTPVQGTAHVEVYADGALYFIFEDDIPSNGYFRVADGVYNPSNWPNDGYYNIANWEFRITVTPAGLSAAAANQGIVYKKGRIRNRLYTGITVQQYGALGQVTSTVEDEVDEFMRLYFVANIQASYQVDMNGSPLNEFTQPTPKLFAPQGSAQLRLLMFGSANTPSRIDRLHYFGHGSATSFIRIHVVEKVPPIGD